MISLFIDVQPHFLKYAVNKVDLIKNIQKQYQFSKENNYPCIIIETVDRTTNIAESSSIIGDREKDIFIAKKYDNAFTQTNLKEKLNEINSKKIFTAGIYEPACFYLTNREAKMDHGYTLFSREGLTAGHIINFKNKQNESWLKNNINYI